MSDSEGILQRLAALERAVAAQQHVHDQLAKAIDDLMWYQRLGDVAEIDKVTLVGPPPRYQPNPTAQGAGNPLLFRAYTLIPRDLDRSRPQPLIVYVHGGVHANFSSDGANRMRELLAQGYSIVAPDYRGSTGYGAAFYDAIDYGGLEIEDTFAARNWMLETYPFLDPARVGIIGWSHGGLHVLLNIFEHPEAYACAFAGVPVSDLIARMGYKGPQYQAIFAAESHIGKTAADDVNEYRRRSPAWNAHKLRTPLLIHTNTSDEDVNVIEVLHLIKSLKAEGKSFEYRVFENEPGGHQFDRIDTPRAKAIRRDIYRFLARYLSPERPVE
jgi:dipeptidyl aminopeptidase/acylaminoacyl peptidase